MKQYKIVHINMIMALPLDQNNLSHDEYSEMATSVTDYKNTCVNFIHEISQDYLAWVDYYKLPLIEDTKRRASIASIVKKTSLWINNAAITIKGVDIVMNDGIQKMAEATAGYPFQLGVFVNKKASYIIAHQGIIHVNLKSSGRSTRKTKLGFYQKNNQFRIETTGTAFFENDINMNEFHFMDIDLKLNALQCISSDVISFTIIVSEFEKNQEIDRRGITTIIKIS